MSDAQRGQVDPERKISDPDFGKLTCWFERSGRGENPGQPTYYWRTSGRAINPEPDVCVFDGDPEGFAVAPEIRDQFRKLAGSERDIRWLMAERYPNIVARYSKDTLASAASVSESFVAQLRPNWINIYPSTDPPAIEMVFGDGWSDTMFVAVFNAIDGSLLETQTP